MCLKCPHNDQNYSRGVPLNYHDTRCPHNDKNYSRSVPLHDPDIRCPLDDKKRREVCYLRGTQYEKMSPQGFVSRPGLIITEEKPATTATSSHLTKQRRQTSNLPRTQKGITGRQSECRSGNGFCSISCGKSCR